MTSGGTDGAPGTLDPREAVLRVLREEGEPMHWTKIQDLALRRGYVDPFTQSDVRGAVLGALRDAVANGEVVKAGKGIYALP